jgi:hypothetical protein
VSKKNKKNNVVINPNMNTLDPESKLAILRAQQLVGKVDPVKYEEVRQEVITGLHPKTKELWEYLEDNFDCEVCELEFTGKGSYGFKIRTPKGTFLEYSCLKTDLLNWMEELNIRIKPPLN